MEIQCPNCGAVCEIDFEPEVGRHIVCPFCGEKFAYSAALKLASQQSMVEWIVSVCPHCGLKESVEAKYVGYTGSCSRCRKDYVIGQNRVKRGFGSVFKGACLPLILIGLAVLVILPAPRRVATSIYQSIMAEKLRKNQQSQYREDKKWYAEQLRYNGLTEVRQATGWTKAGGFILTLDDSAPGLITLDYSPSTDRLIFPNNIQPGFAADLVKTRLRIAEYEAKGGR